LSDDEDDEDDGDCLARQTNHDDHECLDDSH